MEIPEIEKLLEGARREVERRSPYLGPTVVAGAVVLHAARYLRRHADLGAYPQLEAWVEALEQIGLGLWDWRAETLPAPGRPGEPASTPPTVQ